MGHDWNSTADLQVPFDILRATTCCCSSADRSGSSMAMILCTIRYADRHIPQAICSRSASDFAANTQTISGWITSMVEFALELEWIIAVSSLAWPLFIAIHQKRHWPILVLSGRCPRNSESSVVGFVEDVGDPLLLRQRRQRDLKCLQSCCIHARLTCTLGVLFDLIPVVWCVKKVSQKSGVN